MGYSPGRERTLPPPMTGAPGRRCAWPGSIAVPWPYSKSAALPAAPGKSTMVLSQKPWWTATGRRQSCWRKTASGCWERAIWRFFCGRIRKTENRNRAEGHPSWGSLTHPSLPLSQNLPLYRHSRRNRAGTIVPARFLYEKGKSKKHIKRGAAYRHWPRCRWPC